jgi:hypothetical protein
MGGDCGEVVVVVVVLCDCWWLRKGVSAYVCVHACEGGEARVRAYIWQAMCSELSKLP